MSDGDKISPKANKKNVSLIISLKINFQVNSTNYQRNFHRKRISESFMNKFVSATTNKNMKNIITTRMRLNMSIKLKNKPIKFITTTPSTFFEVVQCSNELLVFFRT